MFLADRLISFYSSLKGRHLPVYVEEGNRIIIKHEDESFHCAINTFYKKYYSDNNKRRLILGINPGRYGTGIPFTDGKNLTEVCLIDYIGHLKQEKSSTFIYRVIEKYGGVDYFFSHFLIGSVCPIGFVKTYKNKISNCNYYDSEDLFFSLKEFIVNMIQEQLSFNIDRGFVFVLGTGQNKKYFSELNKEYKWFKNVIYLEHPRYIEQYKKKEVKKYVDKYLELFTINN